MNFLKDRKNLIKMSYLCASIFGLVALIMMFLQVDNKNTDYYNMFNLIFDNSISSIKILFLFPSILFVLLYAWLIYSTIHIFVTKDLKKSIKVKESSLKYAKANSIGSLIFSCAVALFSLIVNILSSVILSKTIIDPNIPIFILFGIFSFFSIALSGAGDYFYDLEEISLAKEIIAEKKLANDENKNTNNQEEKVVDTKNEEDSSNKIKNEDKESKVVTSKTKKK